MQRQQAEAEILRLNAELAAADENLETFSYSVSHDLRAPLRHIVGYVDILQSASGQTLDEAGRRHLRTIAESAAQMERMLHALLAFSRMGRVELLSERVNLAGLVEAAQRELRNETMGREINWQVGELPEVWGDPSMLCQAIANLLSNALKFTRPRRGTLIEIGAQQHATETILFIRDNGIGFDMTSASKLFGMFQRFHPACEFEGAGIGLAEVRRIIRRHGGRTWAESEVEAGATFYFSIPNLPEESPGSDPKAGDSSNEGGN